VRELLDQGLDYRAAATELGIPVGQAYLIATGQPADGSGGPPALPASPPARNPARAQAVQAWIAARVAADGQLRAAAARRTAGPVEPGPPPPGAQSSRDVTVVLTREHNEIRALQQQLQALPGHGADASPAGLARRKAIVDTMTARLSRHERAEEKHLWPAVRAALPDGDQWADGALRQDQEARDTLAALARLDPGTGEFGKLATQLTGQLRKHLAYEERVFLLLREAMPAGERDKLGRKLLAASTGEPARPRPKAPRKQSPAKAPQKPARAKAPGKPSPAADPQQPPAAGEA
jgi:hypothetical protein